jgi:hypothetical protein
LTETGFAINGSSVAATAANPATMTFGGTTIGLGPLSPQAFSFGSGLNLIDVSAQSNTLTSPGDTGSFTFSETFTLTGTGTLVGLNETVTLSGTFNLTQGIMGAIISNMGSGSSTTGSISVAVVSGSGYGFSSFSYSQPTPSSSIGNPSSGDGNLSLTIIPAAVPEPASLAMFGIGMLGVGAVSFRRRRSK